MDVIRTMKPFIRISQSCGLFPYSLKKSYETYFLAESRTLLLYTKVVLWIIALTDGGSVFTTTKEYYYNLKDEISTRLVLVLSTATLYLSFVIIFRTVLKKREVICFWLNEFNNMSISCKLRPNSKALQKFNTRLLASTSFYYLIIVATNVYALLPTNLHSIFSEVVFFFRLWVIQLFMKHFVVLANFVRHFYAEGRRRLEKMRTTETSPKFWIKVLREMRSKDMFVKDFVDVLHSVYFPVLFVQWAWMFVTVLCGVTMAARTGVQPTMQMEWLVFICIETVSCAAVCHAATKEAEKMTCSLQNLFIHLDDPELFYEVELYSLQAQHRKLEFNVLGFYKMDLTVLYSMIAATTTYAVILVQFQNDHLMKAAVHNGTNIPLEIPL